MNKIISIKNLIALTLLLSPVYLIKFNIFSIPLNLLDILILFNIIFWIYKNKNNLFQKIKIISKEIAPFLFLISLILAGLTISSFNNANLLKELGIIKSWFFLPILFGLIIFDEMKTLNDSKKILNSIFFSSFFISIIGLFYILLNKFTYDGRLHAFYLSPNHLAMTLIPGLIIGFFDIFINKKITFSKLFYFLPILVVLFFTHSYGAWFSIILTLFLFLFTKYKKIILILLFIIICFFSLEYNSEKLIKIFNYKDNSSLNSRLVIWNVTKKIIKDNFFIGIGPGNFQNKYLEYQQYFPPYPEWAVPQPHNIFLAFWLQSGLMGLLGFIYLLILWNIKIIKILILSKDYNQNKYCLILFSVFFSTIIYGFIDTTYWKNDLSLIFWSIFFLGVANKFKK